MNNITELLRNYEKKQTLSGTYNAKIVAITVERNDAAGNNTNNKVFFTLDLLQGENVTRVSVLSFKSGAENSSYSKIIGDIAALLFVDKEELKYEQALGLLCTVDLATHTSKSGNEFISISSISKFKGTSDDEGRLLSQPEYETTESQQELEPSETLFVKAVYEVLPEGDYNAIIADVIIKEGGGGSYVCLKLKISVSGAYSNISICLFPNNAKHKKVIYILADMASNTEDLKGSCINIKLKHNVSGDQTYYNVEELVPIQPEVRASATDELFGGDNND